MASTHRVDCLGIGGFVVGSNPSWSGKFMNGARVTVNVPLGLQSEFYDKLNAITHGAALSEEIKEEKE